MYRLNFFGRFSLLGPAGKEVPIGSKKAKALLAYLAQTPDYSRSREEILALLWSDRAEAQGRASLRQVLTGLRKQVGDELLLIDRETVGLNSDSIELVAPNGDEFLAGFHINDPAFEDWLRDERLRAESARSHASQPNTTSVEKPSIAVLPFQNLSEDPSQQFLSDGITEDIITELNRFHSLFVIASASSFAIRENDADLAVAGEKLGVKFLVQGSVRRVGERVRISAQLIDAKNSGHLWSDRFDRDLKDVFSLQDEIAATVASMVSGHVDMASRARSERKHPKDFNAYELLCRSDWFAYSDFEAKEADRLLQKAIGLDPHYAEAHARIAVQEAYLVFLEAIHPREVVEKVKKHANLAASLSPGDAMVHAPLAEAYAFLGEHELAAHHLERSLSLNLNAFAVMAHCAEVAALLGEHEQSVDLIEKAKLRDPYNSLSFRENQFDVYFLAGRYEDALAQMIGWPKPPLHMYLAKAAALAQQGQISEAREAAEYVETRRAAHWNVSEVLQSYGRMCAKPEDSARWLEGFRKARLQI